MSISKAIFCLKKFIFNRKNSFRVREMLIILFFSIHLLILFNKIIFKADNCFLNSDLFQKINLYQHFHK